MRRFWPLLPLSFFSFACDPCDEEILQTAPSSLSTGEDPAAAADILSRACKLPDALQTWLAQPEDLPATSPAAAPDDALTVCENGPTVEALSKMSALEAHALAFDECKLDWLTDKETFVNADGFPLLAAAVAGYFREKEADPALITLAGDALRGQDFLPMRAARLPSLSGAQKLTEAPPAEQMIFFAADGVRHNDAVVLALQDGAIPPSAAAPEIHRFSDHAVASVVEDFSDASGPWYLMIDKDIPAATLRRVAASLPGILHLVGVQEGEFSSASFEVSETAPPQRGDTVEAIAANVTKDGRLGMGPAPCLTPPQEGMACVGGTAVTNGPNTAKVSTFYIDDAPVTRGEYADCVKAGICSSAGRGDADAPVTNLSWRQAHRYCIWAGKRLPTEAEWLAAGDRTKKTPVQEWTNDWGTALEECGEDCQGDDPLGVCDSAPRCRTTRDKVIRGPEGRALSRDSRRSRQVGFRCRAEETYLTTFPPQLLDEPPPALTPLSEEQRALLANIPEDPIWEKPKCKANPGYVSLTCRDAMSYVRSNERRAWVWAPTIRNRGGAYIGVGSDQNYTHSSHARSELVFLTDYDPDVVALHYVNRALTLKAETREEFVRLYSYAARKEALELIAETYADHPEKEYFLAHYRAFHSTVGPYYQRQMQSNDRADKIRWLGSPDRYAYVRQLWQTGRMVPVKADLTGDNAMKGIAEVCRKMGVPVRIFYTSNAPDNWSGKITDGYRRNVVGLPMDSRSIVLQTYIRSTGYGGPNYSKWHFNIQSGLEQQDMMAHDGYTNVREFLRNSIATDDTDMTHSGLRGR